MRFLLLVTAIASLGACTSTTPQTPYEQTLPSGPCAVEGVTGAVPGVTLAVRSDECVYEVGQGGRFTYEVTTGADVPALDIPAGTGCGNCYGPTADPLTWIRWSIRGTSKDGVDQSYCVCDVGCCRPDQARTVQPEITTASDIIEWSGRNWSGPSDTGVPEGERFPPGIYKVRVEFFGYAEGSVIAELPIEIVPAR